MNVQDLACKFCEADPYHTKCSDQFYNYAQSLHYGYDYLFNLQDHQSAKLVGDSPNNSSSPDSNLSSPVNLNTVDSDIPTSTNPTCTDEQSKDNTTDFCSAFQSTRCLGHSKSIFHCCPVMSHSSSNLPRSCLKRGASRRHFHPSFSSTP